MSSGPGPSAHVARRASSRGRARGRALVLALVTALVAPLPGGPAAPASAEPLFVGWSAALPPVAVPHQPSSSDDCVAGRATCVAKVIREMTKRHEPLDAACDHFAVFALAYLRTTETYLRSSETDGFYVEPHFVNHEAVTFAEMYFSAADAWADGRIERVPPAWRTAFAAARDRSVNTRGDLLLGMNAHINRDLPLALAQIGLTSPTGLSRKRDHDQVDAMLNQVVEPLLAELSERYDPSLNTSTPYGLGYTTLLQLVFSWREAAWRAAEELVVAPDDAPGSGWRRASRRRLPRRPRPSGRPPPTPRR